MDKSTTCTGNKIGLSGSSSLNMLKQRCDILISLNYSSKIIPASNYVNVFMIHANNIKSTLQN